MPFYKETTLGITVLGYFSHVVWFSGFFFFDVTSVHAGTHVQKSI